MTIPQGDDLRALINQHKAKLKDDVQAYVEEVVEVKKDDKLAEAANPEAAVYIATQLAAIKAQKTELLKVEEQFTDALKALTGAAEGLRAGDLPLGKVTRTMPTRLNVRLVSEMFPYDEYPGMYNEPKEEVTFRLDTKFKAQVLADQQKGITP